MVCNSTTFNCTTGRIIGDNDINDNKEKYKRALRLQ
jgi:hypothetical protein